MPVSSSSIRMPSCDTASSIAFCSAVRGNSMCSRSGEIAPRTLGPSSTPDKSWPIIAGWPIRCIASPSNRPHSSSRMIWAMNTASEGLYCAVSASSGIGATISNPASSNGLPQPRSIVIWLVGRDPVGICWLACQSKGGWRRLRRGVEGHRSAAASRPAIEARPDDHTRSPGPIKRNAQRRRIVPASPLCSVSNDAIFVEPCWRKAVDSKRLSWRRPTMVSAIIGISGHHLEYGQPAGVFNCSRSCGCPIRVGNFRGLFALTEMAG